MYCRPECRDRRSVYIGGGDARKAAVETLKYYGTNKYDAHKDSYQMYNKYNVIIRSL